MTAMVTAGTALARRLGCRSTSVAPKCVRPRLRFLLRSVLFLELPLGGLLLSPVLFLTLMFGRFLLGSLLFLTLMFGGLLLGSLPLRRLLRPHPGRRLLLRSQALRRLARLALFLTLAFHRLLCPALFLALSFRRLLLLLARQRFSLPQALGLFLLAQVLGRLRLFSQPLRLLLRPQPR